MRRALIACLPLLSLLAACGKSAEAPEYGSAPRLPDRQTGLLPAMAIAEPTGWDGQKPTVPAGFRIDAIATGLKIPRQTLVLPNGDILVAEGAGKSAPALRPKDIISGLIKSQGKSKVEGGNRITLLRDVDGDGRYELRTTFISGLNAPYGLAFWGGSLFVANQDALLRFAYTEGATRIAGAGAKVVDLPSAINHHWTKALAISPDGAKLYVGIGSNSNITERGMTAEENRAMVWEIDAATGAHRPYATGLRNPSALAIEPGSGRLWAAVNERDELGPELVPDYITTVRPGAFYGWPYSYWGKHVDPRVHPRDPQKVAAAVTPDYSLGSHVAPLGLAFSTPALGANFAQGLFVGEHGSWNRKQFTGYKVVFVRLVNGRPVGAPVDFLSGFLDEDGDARGRPVGVTVDPRGAVIVADDLSQTVWRITPISPAASPAAPASTPPEG